MNYSSLVEGLEVQYRNTFGIIHFICEKYVTICISSFEESARDVCLLVYPEQWKDIIPISGNRQSWDK